jgi:hypothetical protein
MEKKSIMRVRILYVDQGAAWSREQIAWITKYHGRLVEGEMVGDDVFRPHGAPLDLYEEEYEVVENDRDWTFAAD